MGVAYREKFAIAHIITTPTRSLVSDSSDVWPKTCPEKQIHARTPISFPASVCIPSPIRRISISSLFGCTGDIRAYHVAPGVLDLGQRRRSTFAKAQDSSARLETHWTLPWSFHKASCASQACLFLLSRTPASQGIHNPAKHGTNADLPQKCRR
jgi:hypothetical protein